MDDMDLFFADKNEIIIDALIHKLKAKVEQFEELVDHYNEERNFRIELEGQVADLKKAAKAPKTLKAPKTPKSSIISKAEAQKISSAIGKRKVGRPKKAVK